jgi:hypothetical protein
LTDKSEPFPRRGQSRPLRELVNDLLIQDHGFLGLVVFFSGFGSFQEFDRLIF